MLQELLSHECLSPPPPCDPFSQRKRSRAGTSEARACATVTPLGSYGFMANSLVSVVKAAALLLVSLKLDSAPCGSSMQSTLVAPRAKRGRAQR